MENRAEGGRRQSVEAQLSDGVEQKINWLGHKSLPGYEGLKKEIA